MKAKTLYLTLAASATAAFLFTLARYVWIGGNPSHRLGYGIFISVVPALVALLVVKLANRSWSWPRMVTLYLLLFALTSVIQSYGRMIPGVK